MMKRREWASGFGRRLRTKRGMDFRAVVGSGDGSSVVDSASSGLIRAANCALARRMKYDHEIQMHTSANVIEAASLRCGSALE